jgi:hypothetical protein
MEERRKKEDCVKNSNRVLFGLYVCLFVEEDLLVSLFSLRYSRGCVLTV